MNVFVEQEVEEARALGIKPPPEEDSIALPGCMEESCCYTLECLWCSQAGITRKYQGETSRAPYIRGKEHLEAVQSGEIGHPIVRHGWEEHQGRQPPFIMRVISRHQPLLDRLTTEAINILELSRGPPDQDLNAKSE